MQFVTIVLLLAVSAISGQRPPPPAPAVSPAPTLSGVMLGSAPAPLTTQMPVNGQLPHLQGACPLAMCRLDVAPVLVPGQACIPPVQNLHEMWLP